MKEEQQITAAEITTRLICAAVESKSLGNNSRGIVEAMSNAFAELYPAIQAALTPPPQP